MRPQADQLSIIAVAGALLVASFSTGCAAGWQARTKQTAHDFLVAEERCLVNPKAVTDIVSAVEDGFDGWVRVITDNAECVHAALAKHEPSTPAAMYRAQLAVTLVQPK